MTFPALSDFLATIPPNLWVGALIGGIFLCLKAHIEGRTAKGVQRLVNEGQTDKLRSDEKQLAMKLEDAAKQRQHEAQEREKDREHEVKKWKHEKGLNLINTPTRALDKKSMTLAA